MKESSNMILCPETLFLPHIQIPSQLTFIIFQADLSVTFLHS